ncbi:MAG: S66 family peptidase [Candidatus Dojkabacteria bacterium]
MIPSKLQQGDMVRVIAPARSMAMPFIDDEVKAIASSRFENDLGLRVSFGRHVNEINDFDSSSIQSRIEDLHEAFADPEVKMVIAIIGGFNSNQLLKYIDYDLLKNNSKILCGFSDITALANAVYAKTGLVTYSGPNYFSFGQKYDFEYSLDMFRACLFSNEEISIVPSPRWSNDRWAGKQEERTYYENEGFWVIREGEAEGTIVGGNQCTLNLLQGTEFMPDINGSILFLEDDYEAHTATVDRDLQSIIHLPQFEEVRGIVFGRFEKATGMTKDLLTQIITSKKELDHLPVVANVDFGHTTPQITFPIGGRVRMKVHVGEVKLDIFEH